MKIGPGKIIKKKIFFNKDIQTLKCTNCRKWLRLIFGNENIFIDDILIQLRNFPLLECIDCSSLYIPDKSKEVITYFLEQAEKRSEKRVILNPRISKIRSLRRKQIEIYKKTCFKCDPVDYEYIPGLTRPWDDGYLTPVFFEKDVLLRYYHNPKYLVTFGSDTYGTINMSGYIIAFGINRNKKVVMWLGEIVDLPQGEQKYLLAYNKRSDHDVGSEYYEGQIEAKFTDPPKERKIIDNLNKLSEISFGKYNIKLLQLNNEAISILEDIKPPIFYRREEVGKIITALNKLLTERINIKEIKTDLKTNCGINNSELKGLGSLKILQLWLEKRCSLRNAGNIIKPIFVLYDLRISFNHILSIQNRKKLIKKCRQRLSLNNGVGYEKIYKTLLDKLNACYQELIKRI